MYMAPTAPPPRPLTHAFPPLPAAHFAALGTPPLEGTRGVRALSNASSGSEEERRVRKKRASDDLRERFCQGDERS